jgi:DNA repair protein RecN (Recombination protein N)
MLQELRVENLLLIEQAQLRLSPGLNVLTGETGAGKTVLAHALDLLLGGRPRQGIVRPGAAEAYVEGTFDLPERLRGELAEQLTPDAQELVLARRVGADGRTRAYMNGRTVTVGDLRDIGVGLLSFYGQHEHRKLTLASSQQQILDGLCGEKHTAALLAYAATYERTQALESRLRELGELSSQRERELGLLEYELGEIDALAPDEAEHEQLLAARERLRSLDSLRAAAGAAAAALNGGDAGEGPGAAELLAVAAAETGSIAGIDPALDALSVRLSAAMIESQELAGELRDYCESGLDGAPALDIAGVEPTLEGVEERLAGLERLMRKHGGSIQSVLAHGEASRARHEELAGAEVALEQATQELQEARSELDKGAASLRRARRKAAEGFARDVREQLSTLAMGEAGFEVVLGEREPGPTGADSVEFRIAANPGVAPGPLREIASGGELSRVMLAIMSVASASLEHGTLVFDEVDAGIGGRTANAVGERLRELGERGQVICITHLPQIASLGARHFSIVKDTDAEPTRTSVLELGEPEVVSELVRMLGADSDDSAALRHARELRRAA